MAPVSAECATASARGADVASRPWYSAACIGGNPDACPRTNTTGDRTCANPAHDDVVPKAEPPHVYLPSGPSESSSDRSCETCGGFPDDEEGVNHVPVPQVVDRAGGRRRRWRCPKCDHLVFKADHVVGTMFACDQPQGVPDDLHPPGEQTVVPMDGVELPMAVEQHQAQQAAEAVTWPKPAPWEAEALRDTPWDADTEPDGDGDPHDQLAAQANEVAWPEDVHNHEFERTDGLLCCTCGAWIEEVVDGGGRRKIAHEAGWESQPAPIELTQHERKLVVAAHLVYHPDTILETVREIVEARLQGREASE